MRTTKGTLAGVLLALCLPLTFGPPAVGSAAPTVYL